MVALDLYREGLGPGEGHQPVEELQAGGGPGGREAGRGVGTGSRTGAGCGPPQPGWASSQYSRPRARILAPTGGGCSCHLCATALPACVPAPLPGACRCPPRRQAEKTRWPLPRTGGPAHWPLPVGSCRWRRGGTPSRAGSPDHSCGQAAPSCPALWGAVCAAPAAPTAAAVPPLLAPPPAASQLPQPAPPPLVPRAGSRALHRASALPPPARRRPGARY